MDQEHKLREVFWTPYDEMKEHIGKTFKILGRETGDVDAEVGGELFKIELEDGTIITAWFEEIYEKSCKVNGVLI